MGSSSTTSTKRRPQSTNTGRTKGAERGPSGTTDAAHGLASPNQKKGASRRSPAGGKAG